MRLEAMAVKIPHVDGHPNRVPFEGVLTVVNAASDKAPAGARGHRVMLTREAAEKALPSLLGMGVDYRPGWDGHDARRKIGLLTDVDLIGQRLVVRGYLYARDFPEVAEAIEAQSPEAMGMSYELADARVEDMRAEVWKLTRVTFTGAAILLREKAACQLLAVRDSMQNAKDSFYMALRTRLTTINPERTILLRGTVRPGILVEEAEAPFSQLPNDVFVLRWLGLGVDFDLGSTMAAEECEILYQTCGTQSFGGLDRGRAMSEMDEELVAMLQPFYTPKLNYTATPPAAMLTQVFWDEPGFAPVVTQRDRLSRSAKVMVYSYQEQGE